MSNEPNLLPKQPRRPSGFSLWGNLTYPQRFTLVALIFALSLLAFLPLILEQNRRIENYGHKEEQGTIYLRFLWQFSTDLQSLHIASIELENGVGSQAQLIEAQTKVEADIIALESASQQYALPLGVNFDFREITNKWAALRSAIHDRRLADIESGFITLHNSIIALEKETGDKSFLILDPDLDTYYLMDTVLLNMTENKAITFQIWQLANQATGNETLSSDKQFELSALVSKLQSNINNLDQNLQTSVQNNANGTMGALLSESQQQYLAASQSYINLIKTFLVDVETVRLSDVVLKASYAGVRDANEVFYITASDVLERGIQTRIQSLSVRLNISIMLAALSILIAYIIGIRIMRTISRPLQELLGATQKLAAGDLRTRIPSTSSDEAGQVARAFNLLAEEVENNRIALQTRADELERRSQELETIAAVARDISIIRDLNTMLNVASSLICESFNFYHVGIYLTDERTEYAILRAASGPSSQELLEQNYKLRIGSRNIVGNVTQTGQAQIAVFAEKSSSSPSKNVQFDETRSEIGLPLRGKSLTIGVLDIHSKTSNAFTKREVQIFQILADQLAAAIDNAQLAQQVEGTINQLKDVNRAQIRQNWENTLAQQSLGFEYDGLRIKAAPQNISLELKQQLEKGKPVIVKQEVDSINGQDTLLVPLVLAGQVIGVIGLERENPQADWTSEEISIAEAAANRASITLENARLIEDSQRRASKERNISEATARISTALSMENILGITAEELERVIGDSEVILQIKSDG